MNARFIVEGYMAGEHKSPYRGFAIEFAQHREYAPGDDVRHLDWKVQAKTERYYIKQYEQETNFVAHLLLDGSESMKYGSGEISKLEYGKMMAACLAYLILHQRDAVALGIFDEEVQEYLPRSDNRDNLFRIMDRLAGFEPLRGTRLAPVLHGMAGQIKRKGIVIVISDFFDDEEELLQSVQHLRFKGHEVIMMQVLDPCEIDFPFTGNVEFEGLEDLPLIRTRPSQIKKSYHREFEKFRERLRSDVERHQCHFVGVRTDQPLDEVLANYLTFRKSTAG
ncbi:MAG: DUF58 domain-containing protein [Verrucomicrobia bacterium]|nr:DUF58 domain-containing protein [Roseibacillus sp.]RCL36532.1 MAG: DUF58 domain-containing protein [Verrucomicrobiota bacterium]RPF87109.1 MAG: DUF58 domain-containing protein [Roseibacillus sp. TMED18]